jgi:molecular chaperone HtpG
MASTLPQEVVSKRAVSATLGKQLLDVITSGMYSDPRMAIREYIQNAADAIDLACAQGVCTSEMSRILVTLDGRERVITVEDNGIGIEGGEVAAQLGSLGCSTKIGAGQRGFRGIGRLGGLAYCDVLRFETRRTAREPVHVVEWNGQALREQVTHALRQEQLADAVRRIAFVSNRRAERATDPDRFFRASMVNVHRFHSDLLMNVKVMREYLSQTAPVAYRVDEFPFAWPIEQHLAEVHGYRTYDVVLNGAAVVRPHRVNVEAREGLTDCIRDVELVECVNRQGRLLCRGWFAQTGFLSALPQHITMRGIRIRQGNIAVGDEYFLKDLFSESRFATWHIGELHATPALKLNARRDGFEESAEYEDFLEWASILCRRLSGLCRQSSKDRSARQSVNRLVNDLERQLSIPFFVNEEHARLFIETAEQQLARLRRLLPSSGPDGQRVIDTFVARLSKLRERPVFLRSILDGRVLRGKDTRQLLVDLCKRILSINHSHKDSGLLLEIVRPYLRGTKPARGSGQSRRQGSPNRMAALADHWLAQGQ